MQRIAKTLIFAGVVMIVGPFFGFTIRGQQETSYGAGATLGIIALVIGIFLLSIHKEK